MMQFEYPPVPAHHNMHHMHSRRTSMPSLHCNDPLVDTTQRSLNQANANQSDSLQDMKRRLSKKSKSDANLSRLTSQERKVDNLPRKAKSRLYKSELCKVFMDSGHCKYGGKCQYAHGQDELRFVKKSKNYKSVPCKTFWTTGYCKYGTRCCFVHNDLGGAFQQTPSPHLMPQLLSRAESQPAMFTPTTIVEEDERVEDDVTPLWSESMISILDLNSIADSIVEDDDQPQDLMDAFSVELVRAKARFPRCNDETCSDVCAELEQRVGRDLSESEKNKVLDAFNGPEVSESPIYESGLSVKAVEFTSFAKHQSMPNVLLPTRKTSRLNVFQQLSTEEMSFIRGIAA